MNGNITIKQLNLFAAVVKQGGITEASRALHLSPSAVSKGLAQLEENVGSQLVSRSTRHSRPTSAGQQLYVKLGPILHALETVLDETGASDNEPSGTISLTCSIAFGTAHLSDICVDFQAKFPKVSLDCTLSDRFENLRDSNYDVALRISKNAISQSGARRIGGIEWGYFSTPSYLQEHGRPQSVIDLETHSCLVYPGIEAGWSHQDAHGRKSAISFRGPVLRVNSSFVLLDAALKGRGIAYLPSYLYAPHKAAGALVRVFENSTQKNEHHFYALTQEDSARNPAVSAFVEFCCEWYQRMEVARASC